MWQRIQTVFLIIAIISLIAAIFLPIWTNKDAAGKTHVLYALHYTVIENDTRTTTYFPYSLTAIFAVAAATVALIEIGKFKNRMLQMKLGALNSLFLVATIGLALYFASQMITFAVDNGLDFTLVPEPTNLALLALGAGALMRRRRR